MKITNTQPGPRGINTVAGPVLVDPGQTVSADVYRRERQHIEAAGWFKVEGDYADDPVEGTAPSVPGPDDQTKAAFVALGNEIVSLRDQIAELQEGANKQAIADRDARIADLEAQLAAKPEATKAEPAAKAGK